MGEVAVKSHPKSLRHQNARWATVHKLVFLRDQREVKGESRDVSSTSTANVLDGATGDQDDLQKFTIPHPPEIAARG